MGEGFVLPRVVWRVSSYSNPSGNCVQVALVPAGEARLSRARAALIAVLDRPGRPVLSYLAG